MKVRPTLGLRRDERGAAAVEFALVSVAFVTFVIGIAYLAIMLFTNLALHWAVERAVRLATVDTAASASAISSEVNGYLTAMGIPAAEVSYSVESGSFPVARLTASLTRSYTLPFIPPIIITYTAEARVPQGA